MTAVAPERTTQTPAPPAPPAARQARPRVPWKERLRAALIAAVATALSTAGVATLLSGSRWVLHALGAIVLVMVLGLAARAARLPRPGLIAVQVLASVL